MFPQCCSLLTFYGGDNNDKWLIDATCNTSVILVPTSILHFVNSITEEIISDIHGKIKLFRVFVSSWKYGYAVYVSTINKFQT